MFLSLPNLPSQNAIDEATGQGHIRVLEILARYNLRPSTIGAGWAVINDQVEALAYCLSKNIYPPDENVNCTENAKILKWYSTRGIHKSPNYWEKIFYKAKYI